MSLPFPILSLASTEYLRMPPGQYSSKTSVEHLKRLKLNAPCLLSIETVALGQTDSDKTNPK